MCSHNHYKQGLNKVGFNEILDTAYRVVLILDQVCGQLTWSSGGSEMLPAGTVMISPECNWNLQVRWCRFYCEVWSSAACEIAAENSRHVFPFEK